MRLLNDSGKRRFDIETSSSHESRWAALNLVHDVQHSFPIGFIRLNCDRKNGCNEVCDHNAAVHTLLRMFIYSYCLSTIRFVQMVGITVQSLLHICAIECQQTSFKAIITNLFYGFKRFYYITKEYVVYMSTERCTILGKFQFGLHQWALLKMHKTQFGLVTNATWLQPYRHISTYKLFKSKVGHTRIETNIYLPRKNETKDDCWMTTSFWLSNI